MRRFGTFVLHVETGELYKNGLRVKLQGQPIQILNLLLEKPGKLISREELQAKLWPEDTFVEFDQALNKAMNRLRAALGDEADNPRFIETLSRRGYRFLVSVEIVSSVGTKVETTFPAGMQDQPSAIRTRKLWIIPAAVLGVVLVAGGIYQWGSWKSARTNFPQIHSLAVLPLDNLSGDTNQEYFADGMTDELITDLAKIGSIRVISRTSIMHYKRARRPLSEIARELNVDAVVEGTVVRSGGRVRISAQLIDARTDQHLWANSYERDIRDVVSLQSELARTIAAQISTQLTGHDAPAPARLRQVDPDAQDAYLKGRYYLNQATPTALIMSLGYFQEAIRRDPNYALGYAGLADAYIGSMEIGNPTKDALALAKPAAETALRLDDTLAESHTSLAFVKGIYEYDWRGSEAEFKRAIQLNPGYALAHHYYSESCLIPLGRHEEAIAEAKKSISLDPLSPVMNRNLALAFLFARQYDRALTQFQKTLALDSGYVSPHWLLMNLYEERKMYPQAVDELLKIAALTHSDSEFATSIGQAYTATGPEGYWQKRSELLELYSKGGYRYYTERAIVYAGRGDKDRALQSLEKGIAEREMRAVMANADLAFDSLRSDSRFQKLMRRMNFPAQATPQ